MGSAVLERDFEELQELVGRAEDGDAAAGGFAFVRLVQVCGKVTRWQWVIHGDTREYRRGVVKWLCRKGSWKKALRFAMCGRGDVVAEEVGGEGVRVRARGCGLRYCPRCSRRSGRRFLSRIGGHLECSPHGEISHFVLTQPVRGGEKVGESRKRFEGAWKKWHRLLGRVGMRSGLLTLHVKPRETWGWHFHGHCVVEWKEGVDVDAVLGELESCWQKVCKEEGGREKELFCRRVTGPGEALGVGGFGSQGEFWNESEGAVERVLQYAIRDCVQGVEGWVDRLKGDLEIGEFAETVGHAKLHRLFGVWRRKVEGVEVEGQGQVATTTEASAGEKSGKVTRVWHEMGSVTDMMERASRGEASARRLLQGLVACCLNRGKVASRLRTVMESVWGQRLAG